MSKVVDIEPKQGKKGTYWRIQFQPGGWHTAFEYDLMQLAQQARDADAEVEFDSEKSGNFSNLKGIRPATAGTTSQSTNNGSSNYNRQTNPIDAERMGKANAISSAIAAAGHIGEWDNPEAYESFVFDFAKRIYAAVTGSATDEPLALSQDEIVQQLQEQMDAVVETKKPKVKW